jgi:hypothetical protein
MDRRTLHIAQAFVICGLVITGLVGCSRQPAFHSIYHQGPLTLSTSNPYLGTNLFLAQEVEKSVFLKNFLSHRGSPSAIEIVRNPWGDTQILLYYPQVQEVYAANLTQREDKIDPFYEWIIQGPLPMRRADYRELRDLHHKERFQEPVLLVDGQQTRFLAQRGMKVKKEILSPSIKVTKNVIVKRVTPVKTEIKAKDGASEKKSQGENSVNAVDGGNFAEPVIPTGKSFRPLNSDEQAIAISKGFARRAANGDIIHMVGSEPEDLAAIVTWYTGAKGNVVQIARRNNIPPDTSVPAKTEVVVPLELVKEFKSYRP